MTTGYLSRFYRFAFLLTIFLLSSLFFGHICIAEIAAASKSPRSDKPLAQARLISMQPLQILLPIEFINPILAKQLASFEGQVISEGSSRFKISNIRHDVLDSGHIELGFTVNAERSAPIVGKIKAKAKARLELRIAIVDWSSSIEAIDSDIRFSNDLLQAAFQLVRPRVERQLLENIQEALDEINQPIATEHPLIDRIRQRGLLSGSLQTRGLIVSLQKR